MARQGITGILQPRVPLHHGFGQVADDGDQGHDPSQQQSGESAEGPAHHPPAEESDQHGADHTTDGPLHGFAWRNRRQRMPPQALTDPPGADVTGHDHQAGGEGDGQPAAAQPSRTGGQLRR